nr:MAG TPA: hypothetical protein [Myoviridae sp. ctNPX13]DAM47443.1 MAG TPA: hypothetical protein [Caudoviricetes sp.]
MHTQPSERMKIFIHKRNPASTCIISPIIV